jgi:hypothetical protein
MSAAPDHLRPGHNAPVFNIPTVEQIPAYLDADHEEIVRRRDKLIEAAERLPAECANDEVAQNLTTYAAQVVALADKAEKARKAAKAPFWDGGKAVDAYFNSTIAKLDVAKAKALKPLNLYQDMRAKEAKRQAEEAARIAREEAARIAAEMETAAELDRAVEAETVAAKAETAVAAAAPVAARIRGEAGGLATSRIDWKFEVTSAGSVPREFLCVDEAAIRKAIQQAEKNDDEIKLTIPGVRIYSERTTLIRR